MAEVPSTNTRSMTAFARTQEADFTWEIRSVNHRHLDVNFKIPDSMRALEPALRDTIRARLGRGKVDCLLRMEGSQSEPPVLEINRVAIERVSRLVDHVASMQSSLAPINPLELLRWPGVLEEPAPDEAAVSEAVVAAFSSTVDQLVEMREREGAGLARLVLDRLDEVGQIVKVARDNAPLIREKLAQRLRQKLADLDVEVDAGRLEQELVYMAQRADVDEELDRLDSHIAEVRSTLASDEPVGRRLDFLMQELNREANTLSSKASVADTTMQAVELKVLIEQMREQIQNIE